VQAALDAADAVLEQGSAPTWLVARGIAAALRAAADQVVPEDRNECECFTNEAIRLNRMGIRTKLLAIAAELENNQ
jgi:hypothetical protein